MTTQDGEPVCRQSLGCGNRDARLNRGLSRTARRATPRSGSEDHAVPRTENRCAVLDTAHLLDSARRRWAHSAWVCISVAVALLSTE